MICIAGTQQDNRSNLRSNLPLMKFVILGFDDPDGATKRKIYRPAHLAKLDLLHSQQRVLLAGPLTDGAGSLIVISAESLAEAEAFAREDPYTVNGVFERIEVHPFSQVFPQENTSVDQLGSVSLS